MSIQRELTKCASSSDPFMDWCKPLGVGINALNVIKAFGFVQTFGEACIYKKVSGSSVAFLILYVDDILLMGKYIELLDNIKAYLNKCFSMKDLGEVAYILGIKIYRDSSRRLIGLSQSTYLDKILKRFKMDQSKKGSCLYYKV